MQTIVLLHGALGSSEDLSVLAQLLRTSGLAVHSFDFSGHGRADFSQNFGIDQFANELDEFLNSNRLANTTVFGYSMGGYVALYLAAKKPGLIGKVITLGTKFTWTNEVVEKEIKMLNPEKMLEKAPAFANMLKVKHGGRWNELLTRTGGMMIEIQHKQFLNDKFLKTVEAQVLLTLADRDKMVTVEETRHVFNALPKAALCVLPQSQHQIETVNANLLCCHICAFIDLQNNRK
jgi:pimeloyl-ACP methyl ester carboxylesterase